MHRERCARALTPSQLQGPLHRRLESLYSPLLQRTASLRQKVYARGAFYSAPRAPAPLEESCFRCNLQPGCGSAGFVGRARKGCPCAARHAADPGEGIPLVTPKPAARPSSHSRLNACAALGTVTAMLPAAGSPCHDAATGSFADKGAGCAQKRCQGPAQPEPRVQIPLHGAAETLTTSPPCKLATSPLCQCFGKKKLK